MEISVSDLKYKLALAIEDAKKVGLRASARQHGVKLSTLRDRVNGAINLRKAHKKEQSLTAI
jgi:hypothetical protein